MFLGVGGAGPPRYTTTTTGNNPLKGLLLLQILEVVPRVPRRRLGSAWGGVGSGGDADLLLGVR